MCECFINANKTGHQILIATYEDSGRQPDRQIELLTRIGGLPNTALWRASDMTCDQFVAVKLLGNTSQLYFSRYVAALIRLHRIEHPSIVSMIGCNMNGKGKYVVTSLVTGLNATQWLDFSPLHPMQCARVVSMAADALHHAHINQVIHGSIKPNNLLIGYDLRPYLTDFGLLRRNLFCMGSQNPFLDCIGYLAPEQVENGIDRIDEQTDVYSLGAVLYRMLTGHSPFTGSSDLIAAKIVTESPLCPTRVCRDVPTALSTITMKCLEKDPACRFQSAHELSAALLECTSSPHR